MLFVLHCYVHMFYLDKYVNAGCLFWLTSMMFTKILKTQIQLQSDLPSVSNVIQKSHDFFKGDVPSYFSYNQRCDCVICSFFGKRYIFISFFLEGLVTRAEFFHYGLFHFMNKVVWIIKWTINSCNYLINSVFSVEIPTF